MISIDSPKQKLQEMASMNISMNADNADEVGRLLDIVKGAAGAEHAHAVSPDEMPPMPPMKAPRDLRGEMENFSSIVNRAEEEVGEEEVKFLTGKDKFAALARKNPNLHTLKNRFNLDIDY